VQAQKLRKGKNFESEDKCKKQRPKTKDKTYVKVSPNDFVFFLNLLSIKDLFIPLSSFDLIYKEGYYVSPLFIVNKYIYPQCFSLLHLREVVKYWIFF